MMGWTGVLLIAVAVLMLILRDDVMNDYKHNMLLRGAITVKVQRDMWILLIIAILLAIAGVSLLLAR